MAPDSEWMLRDRIEQYEDKIEQYQGKLEEYKFRLYILLEAQKELSANDDKNEAEAKSTEAEAKDWKWPLQEEEYQRYSRQMIVPDFGLQGQLRLRDAKVLIIGAGGLGCPAAAYLAGAGVGLLGIVDGDTVEVSNLHRQVAHSTNRYRAYSVHLTPKNAALIMRDYDIVLDCTDRPSSRYLISDACVLLGLPLVSASALQTSGQLMVLNSPPGRGPCYRCVFPRPPPPESVVGCAEGGILGPVVGAMGVLQALEAIKIIIRGGCGKEMKEKKEEEEGEGEEMGQETRTAGKENSHQARMLLFSAMADDTPFRTVRLRGRRDDCFACSSRKRRGGDASNDENADHLTLENMASSLDYVQFCGVAPPPAVQLPPAERVPASTYAEILASSRREQSSSPHLLIDVREKELFSLSSIEGSVNVPMSQLMRMTSPISSTATATTTNATTTAPDWIPEDLPPSAPIYVVCRVGNDSQVAARRLRELGLDCNGQRFIGDIDGGLKAWRRDVDPTLPFI